ncbi:uncharacterized protein LOC110268461 [Arachis ipaensis]|uniref:uncharacterized protein LOC110268461 n=1 Tax=Arachis ipaensis TaxID=130454 RepID=UPI000A2B98F4|nr:uncharacterized protein LOC110268461 [Arachis ipaensis]
MATAENVTAVAPDSFEADPFMHINGVEFVATSATPTQDPTSPQLQNVSIDELFRAIEDLRRDVKELGELKKSMEELTKTSGNIERSLKVMLFKLYHNEDKCKDHDEYNTNLE